MEPLNTSEISNKYYYGHTPSPVNKVLSYNKQNEVIQTLLTDRDILVREEVKKTQLRI
jgi:metaxin